MFYAESFIQLCIEVKIFSFFIVMIEFARQIVFIYSESDD